MNSSIEIFGRFFVTICSLTYFFGHGKNPHWILYISIPILMYFWIFNTINKPKGKKKE